MMTAHSSHNTIAHEDFSSAQIEAALFNYLEDLSNQNCSSATIRNYRSDIKQFYKHSQLKELNEIFSRSVLKKFLTYQKQKGLKDSSVTRKKASINQFALWAKQQGLISNDVSWMTEATIESILNSNHIHIPITPALNKPDFHKTENNQAKIEKSPAFLRIFNRNKTRTEALEIPIIEEKANNKNVISNFFTVKNKNKKNLSQAASNFILPYLNLGLIVLFFIGLGFLGYNQLVTETPTSLAYPSSPVSASRVLSFQGRLTDTAQNPISSATNMEFKIWSLLSGGTEGTCDGTNDCEYKTTTCSVTPDQDGIFNVGIGDDCGSEINEAVFTENSALWLEVIIASETLTPRQPIRTVPFAINSETIQGYPISASG
ncbi:site-specific integrase, partial [Candidatus Pacearchaeota archaeon]|nr:site-specific integrase [Candidatus Pacearchaeota archaeon]